MMLSSDIILLPSKVQPSASGRVAAMIVDVHAIELGGIESAVRALGGYRAEDALDERCLHLVALLKILYCAGRMDLPLQSVEEVKADARELMDRIPRAAP